MGFLREAEALAIELDDQRRLGQVCGATAQTASWLGEHDRAIAYGRRALEIGVNLDDRAIVTIARCRLGHLFATLGSYREAVRILQEVVSGVDEPATTQHFGMTGLPAVVAHTFLAWAHAELGEFEAGEANAAEAFRIAAKHASAFDRVNAAFGFGMLRIRRGQPEAAVPSLTDAMRLCQLAETRAQLPSIAMSLGLAQSLAGRHSDALPLLERASEEHSALGVTGSRSLFLASLAEGCMRAGHTARALGLANDAVELAHHLGERSYEALARWVRAEAAAQSAYEPLTAASDYAAAERLARDLALRPLLGRCLLGRGRLYRRLDRMDEGDAALSEAERLFIALGMTADHLEAARALGRSR
jgi:tetratricopeptide (TPR) repeat protein